MSLLAPERATPARSRRRVVLERVWVAATVGYGMARALLVGATLAQYGVNPWGYLVLDLATSIPLGISTARVVCALVDRDMQKARRWAIVAVLTDFAPDIFIVIVGRQMPAIVYVVLAVIAAASVTFGVRSILRKVCATRQARIAMLEPAVPLAA
jgi:hypothetical protein